MLNHFAGLGTLEDTPIGGHSSDGTESQRRDQRDSLFVMADLKPEGAEGEGRSVRVRNVSSGGLMADASDEYRPGTRVEVRLDGVGAVFGSVAWAEAGRIGIAFDHPIDKTLARKPRVSKDDELFRPTALNYKRPGLKSR